MTAHAMHRKLSVALVVTQVAALLAVLGATPAHATALSAGEWVIGPRSHDVVITLDGRTTARHVDALLRVLEQKKARASFFLPGSWIASHEKKAARLRRAGMVLGNRGWGRESFNRMSDARIRSSISRSQKALKKAGVSARPFARPPRGARDGRVLRDLAAMGYHSVRWTRHPGGGTSGRVKRKAMRKVHDGSIISLDIWRRGNRKALPMIIHALRARGFGLRTLNALSHVHPVGWTRTLLAGSTGRGVTALEKALHHGSYPAGHIDGVFGYEDEQAVITFEKFHHMARDAIVPPLEMESIAAARRPQPPRRHRRHYIDIDISRQVLFEVKHHKVIHTLPVSTGGEYTYVNGGVTSIAHTPRGHFSIIRKVAGWNSGSLGRLWYPNYFVGGFAIHGYPEVPVYPASHGCVRIPMYAAKPFFYREPLSVKVFVHN
jgi:peptidoglycan/xylan/chitin deacetylase (PgdA/CDA1 family)